MFRVPVRVPQGFRAPLKDPLKVPLRGLSRLMI